MAELMSFETR